MAKIGDRVRLTIQGEADIIGSGIKVAPNRSLAMEGTIIDEQGKDWVVRLDISVDGKDRMLVPKSRIE